MTSVGVNNIINDKALSIYMLFYMILKLPSLGFTLTNDINDIKSMGKRIEGEMLDHNPASELKLFSNLILKYMGKELSSLKSFISKHEMPGGRTPYVLNVPGPEDQAYSNIEQIYENLFSALYGAISSGYDIVSEHGGLSKLTIDDVDFQEAVDSGMSIDALLSEHHQFFSKWSNPSMDDLSSFIKDLHHVTEMRVYEHVYSSKRYSIREMNYQEIVSKIDIAKGKIADLIDKNSEPEIMARLDDIKDIAKSALIGQKEKFKSNFNTSKENIILSPNNKEGLDIVKAKINDLFKFLVKKGALSSSDLEVF